MAVKTNTIARRKRKSKTPKPQKRKLPYGDHGITLPVMPLEMFADFVGERIFDPFSWTPRNPKGSRTIDTYDGWIVERFDGEDPNTYEIFYICPIPEGMAIRDLNIKSDVAVFRGRYIGTKQAINKLGNLQEEMLGKLFEAVKVACDLPNPWKDPNQIDPEIVSISDYFNAS